MKYNFSTDRQFSDSSSNSPFWPNSCLLISSLFNEEELYLNEEQLPQNEAHLCGVAEESGRSRVGGRARVWWESNGLVGVKINLC